MEETKMLPGKLKLLFVASIVGWLILVASIYWPPAQSVSVPWALVWLCVAGISAALVVREIRFSLEKHQEQKIGRASCRERVSSPV